MVISAVKSIVSGLAQVLYASCNRKHPINILVSNLKNKILALSLVLLLTAITITSIAASTVKAQTSTPTSTSGSWITSYQINDYNTGKLLASLTAGGSVQTISSPSPGEDLKVTFTVNVFTGGSGDLSLGTSLQQLLQGQYWQLSSGSSYSLGGEFSASANPADFTWTQGTFTMSVIGVVPTPSSGVQSAPVDLVTLYGPTGSTLAQIQITAVGSAMATFLALYNQQNAELNHLISSGVNSGYTQLFTSVLNESKAVANAGDVTDATAMLNALNPSNAPPSSTEQALFLPVIAVVAVVAVVFGFMWFRVRGKVSYFQMIVEDQIKDLEGLTLRISRIDRQSSSTLESVKDRLKRLVGM